MRVLIKYWVYRYKDMESLQAHVASDYFKDLTNTLQTEDLVAEPMQVLFTQDVGGFASKL